MTEAPPQPDTDYTDADSPNGEEGATGRPFWLRVAGRVAVAIVVAVGIIVGAAAAPSLLGPEQRLADGPEHPQWQPDDLATDKLEAQGIAQPNGSVGTVVFDQLHSNRFASEDVEALSSAIIRAGGSVEFTGTSGDLEASLEDADVLVVIDPALAFSEVEVVKQFVDDGGKLAIFGEPNRKTLQSTGFGSAIGTQRSRLTSLASAFGVVFSTEYVYDMDRNDGSFKNPIVGPAGRTDSSLVEGLEQVTLYTPTTVSMRSGDVLLRTSPTAESGTRDAKRGFAVAGLTANGQVLVVGDASFLGNDVSSVGDNDVFVARIVEFMGAD